LVKPLRNREQQAASVLNNEDELQPHLPALLKVLGFSEFNSRKTNSTSNSACATTFDGPHIYSAQNLDLDRTVVNTYDREE